MSPFKIAGKVFGSPVYTSTNAAIKQTIGISGGTIAANVGIFTVLDQSMTSNSLPTSIAKGALDTAAFMTIPGPYTAYMFGGLAFAGVRAAYRKTQTNASRFNNMHVNNVVGGNYVDTQHAYNMRQAGVGQIAQSQALYSRAATQRQAAVQAIQGSKLNARSALGSEARLLHNPY